MVLSGYSALQTDREQYSRVDCIELSLCKKIIVTVTIKKRVSLEVKNKKNISLAVEEMKKIEKPGIILKYLNRNDS